MVLCVTGCGSDMPVEEQVRQVKVCTDGGLKAYIGWTFPGMNQYVRCWPKS